MDRAKQLVDLWPHLPTFRFVAEHQNAARAAKLLGTSPSSVSRSIQELESALGRPLFTRRGRRLELNADGKHLLSVVRDVMRRLDDGVQADEGLVGPVEIGADEPYLALRLPALLAALARSHPGIRPSVRRVSGPGIEKRVLRGELDLGFGRCRPVPGVVTRTVARFPASLYVAAGHALLRGEHGEPVDSIDVPAASAESAFAAMGLRPRWRATVEDLATAARCCRETGLAAVLPDELAALIGLGNLVRVDLPAPAVRVDVASRASTGGTPRIEAVVALAAAADA